jgi:hypothetical protein
VNKDRRARGPELLRKRLDEKTVPGPDGCLLWAGTKNKRGYGRQWNHMTRTMGEAHRLSYELHVGPIPPGFFIDHLCKRPSCVNPKHLRPASPRTNAVFNSWSPTAVNRAKTHCKYGHPFDETNTAVARARTKIGESVEHRRCRECTRRRNAARLARCRDEINARRREKWRIERLLAGGKDAT